MSVCDAVNDVVKAGLWQAKPSGVVKHFVVDMLWWGGEGNGKDDGEWQPEDDESQEAVEIAADEREVRFVSGTRLEAWLTHESLCVNYDSDVNEERDEKRNQNQNDDDTYLGMKWVIEEGDCMTSLHCLPVSIGSSFLLFRRLQ